MHEAKVPADMRHPERGGASEHSWGHIEAVTTDVAATVCAVFDQLEKEGVTYCVVGDADLLPERFGGDIDIVVQNSDIARIGELLGSIVRRVRGRVVSCLEHARNSYCYVIVLEDRMQQCSYLTLDFCGDFACGGGVVLTANELLAGRRKSRGADGQDKCFMIAAPHMEFMYYLLKKIDKGVLTEMQAQHLGTVFGLAPHLSGNQLKRFFQASTRKRLVEAAATGRWSWVRANLPSLRREFRRSTWRSRAVGWVPECRRVISRVLHPTGFVIVLLGPDGSGKSSVSALLVPRLMPMFRQKLEFHLSPSSPKRARTGVVVTEPHRVRARGRLASALKLAAWSVIYAWYGLKRVYTAKVRSALIVYDRYYHDILVDPARYRYGGPMWLAQIVGSIIPKPDMWVVLDASPDVLHERKREVSWEETVRQCTAYRDLARQLPNAVMVDASQSLEEVVSDVVRATVARLADRMNKRMR